MLLLGADKDNKWIRQHEYILQHTRIHWVFYCFRTAVACKIVTIVWIWKSNQRNPAIVLIYDVVHILCQYFKTRLTLWCQLRCDVRSNEFYWENIFHIHFSLKEKYYEHSFLKHIQQTENVHYQNVRITVITRFWLVKSIHVLVELFVVDFCTIWLLQIHFNVDGAAIETETYVNSSEQLICWSLLH